MNLQPPTAATLLVLLGALVCVPAPSAHAQDGSTETQEEEETGSEAGSTTTSDTPTPKAEPEPKPAPELEVEQRTQVAETKTEEKVAKPPALEVKETITAVPPPPADAIAQRRIPIAERFQFGTYGRVSVGTDLMGGTTQQVRVIAHPPRLLEGPYAELDFGYVHEVDATGTTFFTRATLALGGELFHFDGDFDTSIATRNLYLEAQDVFTDGLSFWGGSRMYRGDDIYLLDFWPLDEQNAVGGGVRYAPSKDTSVATHFGFSRLDPEFQTQFITVAGDDFGTRDVLFLERQRLVASLRGEQHLTLSGETRMKGVLYGEAHALPSGTTRDEELVEEELPADSGWLVGGEVGFYGFAPRSYANLFVRYGADLAAFDELAIPSDLAADKTATGAGEFMTGLSANVEAGHVGILTGAYARYFEDADGVTFDPDDVWEIGAALRPAWFITRHLHLIGEANVQYQRPNGLLFETQTQEIPVVTQLALMPSLSLDYGSYARPQLRFLYAATFLNTSALLRFAPEDPRRAQPTQHFLGISVEWWFNSSRG